MSKLVQSVGDPPKAEMPRYQSHKKVWALKIETLKPSVPDNGTLLLTSQDTRFKPFILDSLFVQKHNPKAGGYYVVYDDGYNSYSPAKAFEEGYTLIT